MINKRKKRGLFFIICGVVIIAVMFIPFISVNHGPSGFRHLGEVGEAAVIELKTYSSFDFMYMMISSEYSIEGYPLSIFYISVAIMCILLLCFAAVLIVRGIVLMVTKKSVKQDKLKK